MRKFLLFVMLVSCCCTSSIQAQYYYYNQNYYETDLIWELGVGLGGMNCMTDLGGPKGKGGLYFNELNMKNTRLNGSIYLGVMYQQIVGVRLEGTWGSVQAQDSVLKGSSNKRAQGRYARNLSFKSPINEIALIAEFHPLALRTYGDEPPRYSPYIAAGIGYYSYNPRSQINGRWVDLRPLRTEGQNFTEYKGRENYHLKQANVPVGLGIKYELSPMFNMRFEILHRFLFTDYLDDASTTYIDPALFAKYLSPIQAAQANALYAQHSPPAVGGEARGNPNSKDSYMTFNVKVSATLGRQKR